jgi:hypothetical protein
MQVALGPRFRGGNDTIDIPHFISSQALRCFAQRSLEGRKAELQHADAIDGDQKRFYVLRMMSTAATRIERRRYAGGGAISLVEACRH